MHHRSALACLLLALAGCTSPVETGDDTSPGETDDTDLPLPAAPALVINELLADNASTWDAGDGIFPDWIELYNAGDDAVDLYGMKLSDKPDDPGRHVFLQSVVIPARGHLLLLADGAVESGPDHLIFKLNAGGEELVLTDAYDRRLDWVVFGAQAPDIALGRVIDGDADSGWTYTFGGTPGEANGR